MPDCAKEAGVGLFEPAPERYIIILNVDVVPADQSMDRRIIQLIVKIRPPVVFDGVLYAGDTNNKN